MSPTTSPSPLLGLVILFALSGCAGIQDSFLESSRVTVSRDGRVIGTQERFVKEVEAGLEITSRQSMQVEGALEEDRYKALAAR
ncbi:MAG: hypothetical protein QNI99_17650 [Woeseiaceae bacterium]|nr:hypothetical protein [Woeseiaceae bacterium]